MTNSSGLFLNAYIQADFFGKLIFLMLFSLSIACWAVIIYKFKQLKITRKIMTASSVNFNKQINSPLSLLKSLGSQDIISKLHSTCRKHTINILNKNKAQTNHNHLSKSDIDFIDLNCSASISQEIAILDKNLFVLSTITSLAPFLGLLGTVWGILITFSELKSHGFSQGNDAVLSGLSTALTTTVLGLLIAIPALISYNYFKNIIHTIERDSEHFSTLMLTSIEMQYRKIDLS